MNCREFELILCDLVRDLIMDSATRQRALTHAAACPPCAARMADERTLTAGLRAVVGNSRTEEAPTSIEAALLRAFRKYHPVPAAAALTRGPAGMERRWHWAVGLAAALLLLVLSPLLWPRRTSPQQVHKDNISQPPFNQNVLQDSAGLARRPLPTANVRVDGKKATERQPGLQRKFIQPEKSGPGNVPREKSSRKPTVKDAGTFWTDSEIATEFLPLRYGEPLTSSDGGHVIRVRLPRSALGVVGLPMNLERAHEPIKADVLLGEDGLARAIRFVR